MANLAATEGSGPLAGIVAQLPDDGASISVPEQAGGDEEGGKIQKACGKKSTKQVRT